MVVLEMLSVTNIHTTRNAQTVTDIHSVQSSTASVS